MTEKPASDKAGQKTITLEGYGPFTVRGLLAGENFDLVDKATVIDKGVQKFDRGKYNFDSISLCIEDSPDGPHPTTIYLRGMLSGAVKTLEEEITKLSTVKQIEEKN